MHVVCTGQVPWILIQSAGRAILSKPAAREETAYSGVVEDTADFLVCRHWSDNYC